MAERLTKKDYFAWHYRCGYQNKKDSLERTRKEHKLGKLEDILEKYGIESVEELEIKLEITNESIKKAQQELAEIYNQDRDTWKRACEKMAFNYDSKLKCNTCFLKEQCSKQYGGNYEQVLCDYFYQQAKNEGENGD